MEQFSIDEAKKLKPGYSNTADFGNTPYKRSRRQIVLIGFIDLAALDLKLSLTSGYW